MVCRKPFGNSDGSNLYPSPRTKRALHSCTLGCAQSLGAPCVSVELDDTPLELGLTKYGNNTYPAICIHLRIFLRNQDQHIAKQPIWRKKLQIRMKP